MNAQPSMIFLSTVCIDVRIIGSSLSIIRCKLPHALARTESTSFSSSAIFSSRADTTFSLSIVSKLQYYIHVCVLSDGIFDYVQY
jgi:hypothetical protein